MTEQQPHDEQTAGPDPDRPDSVEPTPHAQSAPGDDSAQGQIVFSPTRFERELVVDAALRRGIVIISILSIGGLLMSGQSGSLVGFAVLLLCVFAWIGMSTISANVWRALAGVTAMIGRNPALAETHLAVLMKKRPLVRWVRLLLYHRLASIRHRQHRFAESAAICRAVLSQPLGPARRQRGSLLLMLAEASLQGRDLHGAYAALSVLHHTPLVLSERLQKLTIQTRYEVLSGHDRAALNGIQQKLLMAELMPAEHCGAMHAMLTTSAKRAGREELADWLWRRSELLCGRDRLDRMMQGAFAVGVVGPPEE